MPASRSQSYHHGDLPAALLTAVEEIVLEGGVGAVSLREAARRAGVSHAAPAHHFGDKSGLLTAFAIAGFELLHRRMLRARRTMERSDKPDFKQCGLAYVDFATKHPAHFAVMFRPEHLHPDDPELQRAELKAFGVLLDAVRMLRDDLDPADPRILAAATGAWSVSHGFATLWLDGELARLSPAKGVRAAAAEAFQAFEATLLHAASRRTVTTSRTEATR